MVWKRPDHLSPPGLALGTSLGTRTTLVLPDFSAVLAVFSVSWLPYSPALPVSCSTAASPGSRKPGMPVDTAVLAFLSAPFGLAPWTRGQFLPSHSCWTVYLLMTENWFSVCRSPLQEHTPCI